MQIHIDGEQWPMAAGCIGLAKLYSEEELPRTSTGVQLNDKILDTLAEKFIRGLIDQFSVVKRDVRKTMWYSNQAKKQPERTKEFAAEVRKILNEQYKKVKKYFSETEECQRLKELLEKLKEIKKPEEASFIKECIEEYGDIASTPFINEKLTLNYVKSMILIPFYGQTSILQKSFFSKSTEEHIRKIEADFIQPAKLELMFAEKLDSATRIEEIVAFLEEHKNYKPFKNLLKPIKKFTDKEQVMDYLHNEMLPCSFIEGLIATQSYEEKIFLPLAFSKDNAVNFNWNFDKKLPVPISAVARLVMFMAPFGMAFYSRRLGNEQASETLRYAGMILSQKHFAEVIKENLTYQKLRGEGSSFEEAIVGLLQESIDKAKKIKSSYFFLEFYSSNDTKIKKTLLDYYHMPAYLTQYIANYGKSLELLYYREFKDAFFRAILKGIDPKEIIFDYLRVAIKNPYHAKGALFATRERKRILQAKKGVEDMKNYDKTISYVYYRGCDLRNELMKDRIAEQEGEPYRASGKKKIDGIAYRLLNAAKAGNKSGFMDTIFRIHMAAGLDVPSIFVDSFKEEGLDFETISSAFIAGLIGQEQIKIEGDVTNG
ncbi:hypothetical protein NST81_14590 [Bacillus sp. FSL W8-0223]|uniref:hypothetical protein n=1 Tax=Bacillus sp. FSL W8-0223 TaxID=2954595 RepID=UPI0030F87CF6